LNKECYHHSQLAGFRLQGDVLQGNIKFLSSVHVCCPSPIQGQWWNATFVKRCTTTHVSQQAPIKSILFAMNVVCTDAELTAGLHAILLRYDTVTAVC
jgi:hypothetical protein